MWNKIFFVKLLRTTREESIFHVENQMPKFKWGMPKLGPPYVSEPSNRRKIDQAMPYFQTIHSLANLFILD